MKHLILVLTLMGAGATLNHNATNSADTFHQVSSNETLNFAGGPMCFPGDPCGLASYK